MLPSPAPRRIKRDRIWIAITPRFLTAHDLFGKPLRTFPDHALLAERIDELSADRVRDRAVVGAVMIGQCVLRHAEGAEQDVPERKRARKIGVAADLHRGV